MTGSVHFIAGTLLLSTLCGAAVAQTTSQTNAAQRQAEANRQRCVNGVLIGGAAGGAVARGSMLNRLGSAAIGATAGCVINRGVNEGR